MFYEHRRPALLCANVSTVQLCIIKGWEYIKALLNIHLFNCWFQLEPQGGTPWWSTGSLWLLSHCEWSALMRSRSVRKRTSCGVSYLVSSAGTAVTQTGVYRFLSFCFSKCDLWVTCLLMCRLSAAAQRLSSLHSRVTLLGSGGTSRPEPVLEEKGNPLLLLPLPLSLPSSLCFANHDSYSLPLTDC